MLTALLTILSVIVAPLTLVGAVLVATASPAQAAPVSIGTIRAQMRDHTPTGGDNCIRYSPSSGSGSTNVSSAWVTSTGEARTAHGRPADGYQSCPTGMVDTQSVLGFTPTSATSVETGTTFLLGRMRHLNNPVYTAADDGRFAGTLGITLDDTTMTFPWTMWETTNTQPCPAGIGWNNEGCDDQTAFTSQIGNQTITIDGIQYRLVVQGFTNNGTSATCSATPNGAYVNDFQTVERKTTYGCLYAQLSQIRTLQLVKDANAAADAPSSVPGFGFSTTSNLAGSPWAGGSLSLTPTLATNAQSAAQQILAGSETVTVTEVTPPAGWALTDLVCVDGVGQPVTGITYDVGARTVRLANVPEASSAAAVPIRCTFTNVYTSRATLTLVKSVTGGGPGAAADWTLTASRSGTPSGQISGPGNTAAVTNQSVVSGTWTLTETPTGANSAGYQQQGAWVCVTSSGSSVPVAAGRVTLADGARVTCTVVNRFVTGSFSISKTITGETAGFTGTAATPFTGSYSCSDGRTGTFSTSTGTAWTSPRIPAGVTCTVAEDQPTGNLANSSYRWGTPGVTYPAGGANVAITDGGNPTVALHNPIARVTGTLQVSKVVEPVAPATAAGYTGGGDREFPVTYTCAISGGTATTGTVDVTTAGAVTVPNVPAGSVCTFTEDLTAQDGDFADASFSWTGHTFEPASVTIPADGVASTTVTNTFTRSIVDLTLSKIVDGEGYLGTGTPFEIAYDCGAPFSGTVDLAAGGSETVRVPAGVQCTVVETAPDPDLLDPAHAWGTPTYDGLSPSGTVTVPAGGSGEVTVTNPTIAVFGDVQVTKAVEGELAGLPGGTTFDITLTCSDGSSHTAAIGNGGSFTLEDVPVGSTCTATEAALDDADLIDDSYAWGDVDLGESVTVVRDDMVGITVTNQVVRAYGSLAIIKTVDGMDGLTGSGVPFSGTWTCSYGSGAVTVEGTWAVTGSGTASMTGPSGAILLGSTCSVTESTVTTPPAAGDPSYQWGAPQIDGAVTLTAAEVSGEIGVTNPILRVTGSFGISKTVTGDTEDQPGHDPSAPFGFGYTCTDGSGETHTGTLSVLPTGEVADAGTIPGGSDCTVTETSLSDPIDPYRWDSVLITVTGAEGTQSGSSVSFTTPSDGTPVVVVVENVLEARTAAVVVTKDVTGETAGFTGGSTPMFPITLVCDGISHGPLLAADGGSVTFPGIPLGADCTVGEGSVTGGLADGSYAWSTPTIAPGEVTVSDDGASAAVENPIVRVHAPVALTKIVDDGGFSGILDPERTYSGTWSCAYGSDAPVTGTWSVTGAGAATLSGGGSDGTEVLVGSACTATEDGLGAPSTDPSFTWETPAIEGTTVTATGTATMTVTNTLRRDVATLTVAKEITGETAGYVSGDFPIGYECSVDGVEGVLQGELDVAPGGDAQTLVAEVPVGWECTISEGSLADVALADASFAWGTPVITIDGETTSSVTVTDAGATIAVEVTNPIERVLGTLQVVKELETATPAGVVEPDAVFSGTYACVYDEGGDAEANYSGTWSITGTGVATLDGDTEIPLTSSCTVTETAPQDGDLVDDSWTWGEPVTTDAVVTTAQVPAQLTVTNAVERVYGGLSVTKVYAGADGAFDDGLEITGAWICYEGGSPIPGGSGTWQLPAGGGTVEVVTPGDELLPATAACVVTEDTLDDGDLTDASWTWLEPTFEPEGATPLEGAVAIEPDAQAEVTITNDTARVYADLQVTKVVTGDAIDATGYDPDVTFTGTYQCTHGDTVFSGTWGPMIAGQTVLPTAVAYVGSVCTVTEDAVAAPPVPGDASFVWLSPSYEPASVELTAEGPGTFTVTNPTQRVSGSLAVAKAPVVGASDAAPEAYDFAYECTAPNGDVVSGSLTGVVAGGEAVEVDGVPVGSTCVVTEEPLAAVDGPFTWQQPTFAVSGVGEDAVSAVDGGVELVLPAQAGAPVVVTATNTLDVAAEVTKTFVGAGQHVVDGAWDGTWDLRYTIEVSNPSEVAPVEYSLTDTVDYDGVTVNGGSASSAAGDVVWDDVDQPFVLVPADAPVELPGGGSHTFEVVVNVTAPASGAGSISDCEAGDGGLLNTAEVRTGEVTDTDTACAEIPADPGVTVTKKVVGTPTVGDDGLWTVTYEVVVSATDADRASRYDLTDELHFGDSISVESATVTGPGARAEWDGVDDVTIATGQVLAAGAQVRYEVVVRAAVGSDVVAGALDCTLTGDETGTGFLNEATVTTAAGEASAQACADPPAPTEPVAPAPPSEPAPPAVPPLPSTGADIGGLLGIALALLLAGGVTVLGVRRRQTR